MKDKRGMVLLIPGLSRLRDSDGDSSPLCYAACINAKMHVIAAQGCIFASSGSVH
jgi:hypothetical protein